MAQFEPSPDGRLFVTRVGAGGSPLHGPYSKPLPMGTAYRAWQLAREVAPTPEQVDSPLARRPYDLRHACVDLAQRGVPPTQVADWAGHSAHVLLRVYAKCVCGQEVAAMPRIEDAMRLQPEDGD